MQHVTWDKEDAFAGVENVIGKTLFSRIFFINK